MNSLNDARVEPECQASLVRYTLAGRHDRDQAHPYETITFARFSLEWLSDGDDHASPTRPTP